MDIDFLIFFDNVKELAKTKNVTIETMIQSIEGLSFNSINTYNSFRKAGNLPRADDVLRIAEFFGVSVEYLITGKMPDNREKINKIKDDLLNVIRDLDSI